MRIGARPPRPAQFDFVFESGLSPRAGLSNGSVNLNGGCNVSNQQNRRLLFGIFGLAIVISSGCGLHDSSTGSGTSPSMREMPGAMQNENPLRGPVNGDVSFSADIQPIFDNRCTRCHNGVVMSGRLDLSDGTSYDSLVNQPTSPSCRAETISPVRVVPGDPEVSMLWRKTKP